MSGTVQVRVAVVVQPDGWWYVGKFPPHSDEYPRGRLFWLTAELPLPHPAEPQVVSATVEPHAPGAGEVAP